MKKWEVWEEEFLVNKSTTVSESHKLGTFLTEDAADNMIANLKDSQERNRNPKQFSTYSKREVEE